LLLSLAALSSVLLPIIMLSQIARAQEGALDKSEPKGITSEEIVKRFASKEKEFKTARDQYTFRQDVKVMTLDGDTPDGNYQQVFDVTFDDKGRKIKNVVFAPQPTLQRIQMTEEDFDDIENRLPFVLTSDEIGEYDILYVGQQKQDELNTYVFDVAPKQIVGKKRYFQGRPYPTSARRRATRTCSPSSPPGANRLTASTGSPPTRAPRTRSSSPWETSRSARSSSTRTTDASERNRRSPTKARK
jgi:hypothetical protein